MRKALWMGGPLLAALFCTSVASAQLSWRVVESNSSQLQVVLEARGARLRVVGDDGADQSYSKVELAGAPLAGEPGFPLLPASAHWFALPPQGEATLEVEILERELLGTARLLPAPVPEIEPRGWDGEPRLVERSVASPEYSAFRRVAGDVVKMGAPVFHRRQRMASLRVSPIIYDAASGRTEVATRIRVTVRFPRAESLALSPEVGVAGLRAGLLNPTIARQWSCLSPRSAERKQIWSRGAIVDTRAKVPGTPRFDAAALQSTEVRLRVSESSLHRVQMSDLIGRFQFPTSTLRKNVRLYQKRPSDPASPDYPTPVTADVPLLFLGSPDENAPVDASDEIIFYGLSAQDDWGTRDIDGSLFPRALPSTIRPDHYNSHNVYWLAAADPGSGAWARMTTETLGTAQGPAEPHFRRTKTFTGDAAYKPDVINASRERYYWNDWDESLVERTVPLFSAVQDSTVRLSWSVVGSTRFIGSGTARMVEFYVEGLNGRIPVGAINSDLRTYRTLNTLQTSIPASDLADGFMKFGMEYLVNGSPSRVGVYLQSLTVDYASRYRAAFNDLEFTAGQSGVDVDLLVDGFDRTDLLLFDVTDPHAPRAIDVSGNLVDQGNGSFQLSLHVPQAAGTLREFRVAPRLRIDILRNQELEEDTVPSVFDGADDLQVIAVGPESFRDTMASWVQWRTTHDMGYGWNVGYVDVQQIYDDFSGGLQSPQAIHDFVEYAYIQWNAQALLLVGDANEDARGVGKNAGVNLVPPSLHLQIVQNVYELLASDKWYGVVDAVTSYPTSLAHTSDLLVGRLPAQDPAGLQVMLDKIYAYEQPRATDTWRGQSYWMADDAYSSELLGAAVGGYRYQPAEDEFGASQQRSAVTVSTALDSLQQGIYYNLDEITAGCRDELCTPDLTRGCVAGCFSSRGGTGRAIQSLSQGWLLVSYQGHAAFNVLAHETLLQRNGLAGLTNNGRPFIFFGMGCHVSDFLQSEEGRVGNPIGEFLVTLPEVGAIATYGSSGFEFLYPNAAFMEEISDTIFRRGRVTGVAGQPLRSQWVLGEVLAQAEENILPNGASQADAMVAQYNLLGDPLLRIDALPPRLRVRGASGALADGAQIVADAGSSGAAFVLEAIDETGISHLDVVEDPGVDRSSLVQWASGPDPRRRSATLDLPIVPRSYDVDLSLYDGAYPDARPTTLRLHVELGAEFLVDGQPFDPKAGVGFPVGQRVSVDLQLSSPVDLTSTDIGSVSLTGGVVGPVTATGSGRQWTLSFGVTAESAIGQVLSVELAGVTEDYALSAGPGGDGPLAVQSHFPYPNPARLDGGGAISVVARTSEAVQWARLLVYDLSGRLVYERRDDALVAQGNDFSLAWDGRSPEGGEVANGTYFYRLEVGAGTRTARSDMGRIVVMR